MIKSKWALVIATLAITSSIVSFSHSAEARSILDILFGDKKTEEPKGPPPEVSLQAPFASPTPKGTTTNTELMQMYNSPSAQETMTSTSLDQPHRSPQQISEWVSGIVSQAMTISPETWDADFAKISPNFTSYATQEYKTYVQSVNLVSILTSNQMRLQAISNDSAIVAKEGAIDGTYHWLVQVPLMTSFYKTDMKEVDKNAQSQNQNLLVQVQVGRVQPKSNTDIGLVIERWRVSSGTTQ